MHFSLGSLISWEEIKALENVHKWVRNLAVKICVIRQGH